MSATVLLLATLSTKAEEADYLAERLTGHGVTVRTLDISLQTGGQILGGSEKVAAIEATRTRVWNEVVKASQSGADAIIGIGGGTGGEIILQVLRALPITFPKVLVTTLPFDPRIAVADNSIVLVPTLADICGLNATLREVLENAAAMTAGLCATHRKGDACVNAPSIGMTALGVTENAAQPLVKALRDHGQETTVFHANGYGGAAFTRFAQRGAFHTIIDLTPHELTRIELMGAHVDMPERFSAARDVPRIVLPGGLNFIGLGEASLVPPDLLERPHYAHSGLFTHIKLTQPEMEKIAQKLAHHLNALPRAPAVIVPMGGFSHQDCVGGTIEDPALRGVFLDVMRAELSDAIHLQEMPDHISSPNVTTAILDAFKTQQKDTAA